MVIGGGGANKQTQGKKEKGMQARRVRRSIRRSRPTSNYFHHSTDA